MRNKKPNYILLFLGTLVGVVAVGMIVLYAVGNYRKRPVKTPDTVQTTAERTTESLDDVTGPAEEEASIDENEPVAEVSEEETDPDVDTSANSYIHSGVVSRYGDDLDDPEYLAANRIYVMESRDSDSADVSLTFAGDILFDDEYAVFSRLLQNGGQINAGIDQAVINIMKTSDVTMVNNEFPYTYGGAPTEGKTYTFRADPSTVHLITDMGANAVGIANNHAYDFGKQSFLDTMSTLNDAGIPFTGGGNNIAEASAPLYFVIDDMKIGIIAATQIERLDNPDTRGATDTEPGVFRCLNPDRLLSVVSGMKDKCDFTVVFIHWGTEGTNEVDWLQTDQAPKLAEAGADVIIGAHPHVLQPIGKTGGIPVVYSLGNFWFNSKDLDTGLVQIKVNSEGIRSMQFIPCRQSGCKTHLATGEEHDRIINEMRAMSPGITIDQQGYITY